MVKYSRFDIYLRLYVDDSMIAYEFEEDRDWLMKELNSHTFKVDGKGVLDYFLGIGFKWNSDGTVFRC